MARDFRLDEHSGVFLSSDSALTREVVIHMCTILVSNHSENRAKGMNIMHSCYALGALICPFVIAGAGLIGPVVPMFTLGFLGLIMWIIFHLTPFEKKTAGKKSKKQTGDF